MSPPPTHPHIAPFVCYTHHRCPKAGGELGGAAIFVLSVIPITRGSQRATKRQAHRLFKRHPAPRLPGDLDYPAGRRRHPEHTVRGDERQKIQEGGQGNGHGGCFYVERCFLVPRKGTVLPRVEGHVHSAGGRKMFVETQCQVHVHERAWSQISPLEGFLLLWLPRLPIARGRAGEVAPGPRVEASRFICDCSTWCKTRR